MIFVLLYLNTSVSIFDVLLWQDSSFVWGRWWNRPPHRLHPKIMGFSSGGGHLWGSSVCPVITDERRTCCFTEYATISNFIEDKSIYHHYYLFITLYKICYQRTQRILLKIGYGHTQMCFLFNLLMSFNSKLPWV